MGSMVSENSQPFLGNVTQTWNVTTDADAYLPSDSDSEVDSEQDYEMDTDEENS